MERKHNSALTKNARTLRKDMTKEELINEYYEETGDPSLTAAREVLGEEFTYFELKICRLNKK